MPGCDHVRPRRTLLVMETKQSSVTAAQVYEIVSRKLPPRPPPSRWEMFRAFVGVGLTDTSDEIRVLRYFVARIVISVLIGVSLLVVGGTLGFTIALLLFALGLATSVRIRRLSRALKARDESRVKQP